LPSPFVSGATIDPAAAGFDIQNALALRQARSRWEPAKPWVPLAQTGLLPQPLPKKRLLRGGSGTAHKAE
jgi:hypothetical protein